MLFQNYEKVNHFYSCIDRYYRGGGVCFSQSNNNANQVIKKASEKETIFVTVTEDKVKDTIASLEKDGWTFEAMAFNRADRTWTITMSRWDAKKSYFQRFF